MRPALFFPLKKSPHSPNLISQLNKFLRLITSKNQLQILHAQLLLNGLLTHLLLSTKLTHAYSLFGDPHSARLLFDTIHHLEHRRPFIWNVMLRGYTLNHCPKDAFQLYKKMLFAEIKPDNFTFSIILKCSSSISAPNHGSGIHAQAIVNGYASDVFVETAIVDMYMKFGSLNCAYQVFDRSSNIDIVLWNSIISGFVMNESATAALEIAVQMEKSALLKPDWITITSVLSACGKLRSYCLGEEAHAYVIRHGLDSDIMVCNSLMDMYGKCGCLDSMKKVNTAMTDRDCSSWNVMISGFYENGSVEEALMIFKEMLLMGVKYSVTTVLTMLPIFASLGFQKEGRQIHCHVIKTGLQSDIRIETSLIDMYAKNGSIDDSNKVFERSTEKDLVTWNAMLTGRASNSLWLEVFKLFHQLQVMGMEPDSVTLNTMLIASENLQDIWYGKSIHGFIIKRRLQTESSLLNSLVSMYAKCGRINEAYSSLITHCKTDPIPWNALLACLHPVDTISLLQQMRMRSVKPNSVTFLCLISACAHLAAPSKGRSAHGYILKSGFKSHSTIGTSLMNMYAKCGDIHSAISVFNGMVRRDSVSWSTAIAAYGAHGFGSAALQLFKQMRTENSMIDQIAFTEILSACTHSGLIEEGRECFQCMIKDYSLEPKLEHYSCMVDLMGRAGHLDEAEEFIWRMPMAPDAGVWRPLLSACRIHGNVEMGQRVFKRLVELEPENTGNYILLSNIYAGAGKWDGISTVRTMMERKGLTKTPGCSWLDGVVEK